MPLAEAAALASRVGQARETSAGPPASALPDGGPAAAMAAWSHPTILPHDPAADLKELARLAERCERFSPMVGWKTAEGLRSADCGVRNSGPDCLFLDVTGIGVLFGGEQELGRELIADLRHFGHGARAAIADTIGAAWAVARQQSSADVQVLSTEYSVLSAEKSAFSSASDLQSPICNPQSAIRNLPLDSLRLPAETLDLLSQLGIVNLEQLLALPRESLRARFDELLLLRIDQLLGTAQEVIVPHRPPPQFIEEWLLECPDERREALESILRELVHRIAAALAVRREGVLRLACRLDCAPGWPVLLQVNLFRPSADEDHLWNLLQMQLEQTALPGAVGRLQLEVILTAPLENRQGELFAGGKLEAERQFAALIDRCSSRLGAEAVLCPQLTADSLPERAVRYKPGVRGRKPKVQGPRSKVQTQEHSCSALLRPLALHSPPSLLDVLSIAPDGPPISFRWQGEKHEVAASSGPELIETGWWRGTSVRRDYWRIETATGQRLWLFRQLGNGQWFLHGEYA
jgi:protein ImuB